jgi:uncharacterized protein (TIGR02466 family)
MESNIETINLFPIPIKKVKIIPSEHQYNSLGSLIDRLLSSTSENNWALESGKSTGELDLYLYKKIEMKWLVDAALLHANNYWQDMDYRRGAKVSITSSWANLHTYGQVTGEHSHCGGAVKAHISAVYYLKKPKDSGNIKFTDPLEYIHKMTPAHNYDETFGSTYCEVDTDQFDLILFPSWLKHQTQPNMSYDDRVAISINFIGTW